MKDKQFQLFKILAELLPCNKYQWLGTFVIQDFGRFDKVDVQDLLFSPHIPSHYRITTNAYQKVPWYV